VRFGIGGTGITGTGACGGVSRNLCGTRDLVKSLPALDRRVGSTSDTATMEGSGTTGMGCVLVMFGSRSASCDPKSSEIFAYNHLASEYYIIRSNPQLSC